MGSGVAVCPVDPFPAAHQDILEPTGHQRRPAPGGRALHSEPFARVLAPCLLGSRVGWAVRLGSMCGVIRIHGAPGELETAALKAASCPPGPGRQAGGRAGAGVRRAAGALCHVPGLLRTCGHWAGAVLKSVLGEHRGQVGLLSTCKGPGVGQAPADSRGQGSLACRSPWGRRVSHD